MSDDTNQQISYALGYDIFEKLKANFELDPEYYIMGIKDNHKGQSKMSEAEIKQVLVTYQRLARQKQIKEIKKESEKNKLSGEKFLEDNKKKEGVIVLPSGMQYKILAKGDGPSPGPEDKVECHYKGTLIDGTVFDSSYRRGAPAQFQVNGVIKGWIEALQLMKTGSRWMLFIPSDLAYGDRGAGNVIKPGSTLIFEVELIKIVK
ncbi:MAG: FKBP-type peptidyl-prolyl cis-trans isomerase [Desulfobacteraceae bacterium]|nr:FKBP-type peptidyl-prolyl cis-trans isomerase [Desulfobacteraceae bacterium]